jgi:uncharacterized protein YgbK (DUF1537 family)
MIVAIADDMSGAAEIAGIGWRFGLAAQVQTRFVPEAGADLIVVTTGTRSVTGDKARSTVEALARRLSEADVSWCYKKVDSVLRGHVCIELGVLMKVLGKPRAILAPANPSRGRTIVDGRYFIDKQPLHETDFAHDPEYPATSCQVMDLLHARGRSVVVLNHSAYDAHEEGIVVAETEHQEDLSCWAAKVDDDTLASGGSDFFSALLEERVGPRRARLASEIVRTARPKLFVCGSASEYSRRAVRRAQHLGISVCPMPDSLLGGGAFRGLSIGQWTEEVLYALRANGRAIVAITKPVVKDAPLARQLAAHMAALTEAVVRRTAIGELVLEGGATAEAVLGRLGRRTWEVLGEYEPGVVQLHAMGEEDLFVTVKPGSYPWPADIWNQCREGTSYAK